MSAAKKPSKVLTSYYRPKPGGLCKRLFRTINALLKEGHEVHYLSVVRFPIDEKNCYYHRFPWPESKTETPMFWVCFHLFAPLILLYIGFKYKVTHLFAFSTNYAFFLQPLRVIRSLPLTLFLRGDAIENHKIKGKRNIILLLEKKIEYIAIQGVNLYGVSEALVDAILSRHNKHNLSNSGVIRNDISAFCKRDIRASSKPLKLVCVGVLENRKNQQLLLECMQFVSRKDAIIYFYGAGPKENELIELAKKLRVYDKVRFEGWVDSSIIWPTADILLQPSMHEGAPNSVLEAIAYGIPVLASDIPEHGEILPSDSLISIDNSRYWSKAINEILLDADNMMTKLRENQELYADKLCFDWESEICKKILV